MFVLSRDSYLMSSRSLDWNGSSHRMKRSMQCSWIVSESRPAEANEMMSLGTAGDLWPPASALARISTAHFQHQTSDIERVTEIHESRPPAL
jgi:hypothetical protein